MEAEGKTLDTLVTIIKLLRAKWFTVEDTTDENNLRPTRSMETSDKTQSQYCVCSTKEK